MTAAAARRTALAAQGFGKLPAAAASRGAVHRLLERTRLLQLDSVTAVTRAHYLPVFSRLGAYDRALVDEAAWSHRARRPRRLVEYWAHEAALVPIEDWPLLRWRMAEYGHGRWGGARKVLERDPGLPTAVLAVIAERGPSTAAEIERALELGGPRAKDHWGWNHSDTKVVCEQLFAVGELSVDKRVGFQRYYDLTERVLPAAIRARTVAEPDAVRELMLKAAAALGVGTAADLRDYYRLRSAQAAPALAELVAAGELEAVSVAGWDQPAYRHPAARTPRRIEGTALLCPFDPLVFYRPRTERMFGFHYRIEIYTPAAERVHGYYVLPFLSGDRLVARVDVRADRATGRLLVPGAFAEPDCGTAEVAADLADSLRRLADWLELDTVEIGERGDLAARLRAG
ncbi:winged helix-turn-helix domain-containing protein [Nocardia stercoris]|uniref:Winged helix-turn-helix domain-containing protein n=1 Tax=Nocardia stercoris TaxID=2483361 RepID=A0A3M2KUF0_9NOCA|nr:crosslink repair DNA glycosylase YcaQ family protein [Nocardia stercoris]RMI28080.1 winged helix-turn-helix domain-containing protein [Nocardia stercoris]